MSIEAFDPESIPAVTTRQMVEVDRATVEDVGIQLLQMMESAGRNLAHLARERFLASDVANKSVVVLAGTGGNGGGAMAAARRLANWGADVEVVLVKEAGDYRGAAAHQIGILQEVDVRLLLADEDPLSSGPELILDGLIGYSLSGRPRGSVADTIRWANAQPAPVLALDVPSGLDATTGEVLSPTVKAIATMTLALPKTGLLTPGAEEWTGELYLADISVPDVVYQRMGLDVGPVFRRSDIVRLR